MLTEEQQRVADHSVGHAIVDAVAGSGKTHTLIERINTLLKRGVTHRHILILMFNKQAQVEFNQRLRKASEKLALLPPNALTFHGFGYKLCREFEGLGWLPVCDLLSDGQRDELIRRAIRSTNGRLKSDSQLDTDQETVVAVADLDAYLKAELLYHDQAFVDAGWNEKAAKLDVEAPLVMAVYDYERIRVEQRKRAFIDMIHDPYTVLASSTEAVQRVQNRYEHCLIDEMQDIDELQIQLVRIVAGDRAQMMVVGDGDQCIYAWRGAKPEYIVSKFAKLFPGTVRYAMTTTFRYGPEVAVLANGSIQHNQERVRKSSTSADGLATDVQVFEYHQDSGQSILRALGSWDGKRSETAILVREYAHSIPLELALSRAGIPYQIEGAQPFVERKEVLTLYAHLALGEPLRWCKMDEQRRVAMLEALLTVPTLYLRRAVVESAVRQINHAIVHDGANPARELVHHLERMAVDAKGKALPSMIKRISKLSEQRRDRPAASALEWLMDDMCLTRFFIASAGRPEIASAKIAMTQYVVAFAQKESLSVAGLLDALDAVRLEQLNGSTDETIDPVLITSAHRSKGLEWPHVIVPELAEGRFPGDTVDDMEAERRLYYVAITRARKRLSLLVPIDKRLNGVFTGQLRSVPRYVEMVASRFVFESFAHARARRATAPSEDGQAASLPDSPPLPEAFKSGEEYGQALTRYLTGKGLDTAFVEQSVSAILEKLTASPWRRGRNR